MRALTTIIRAFGVRRWGGVMAMLALAATPAAAQVAAGYSEYYVPGGENEMHVAFRTMGGGTISASTHATITITAWADDTIVYYDHWENGLGFDPANPGTTADETFTLGSVGSVLVLDDTPAGGIPIPRNPANTYYDGGDRIYVAGGAVTVTRASYPQVRAGVNPGLSVQAVAWEVYPVKPQLTTYILPFGENLSGSFPDFLRTYVLVQATANGTTFTVDLNGDGTADRLDQNFDGDTIDAGDTTTVTLQAGQTFFLGNVPVNPNPMPRGARATVNSGAVIQGSSTLQVKFVIGDPAATYETRGISAFPRGYWTQDYYAPVNEPAAGPVTDIFLYNPNAADITVDWETQAGSGSFTVGAGATVSYRAVAGALPTSGGVYLRGSDVFWGVSTIDSTGPTNEWAYSLLPTTLLYSEHYLGWAPGGADGDDSGVFLTVVQDNTRLFVDTDGDGTADQTYTLDRLQTQYITDVDGDLSGTRFWATGPFTMSFGQNPDTAPAQALSGDLGYVAIPGTDFISLVLSVDKSVSPQIVPTASGSQATFTLTVRSQQYTVDGVTVSDTLPPNWQYVPGSTTITRPDLTTLSGVAADPTIAGQALSWSAAQTGGNMAANQTMVVRFTAQTTAALPTGTLSENRVKAVGTRTVGGVTQTFTTTDFAYVVSQVSDAGGTIQINKLSSVTSTTPVYPGDTLTYTTTVSNPAGSGTTLTGVTLYDPIPAGLTYAGGASLTCDLGTAVNLRDQFGSAAYNNSNGSVSWSANPWVETDALGGGATGGLVWITGGQLQFRYQTSSVADTFSSVSYARQDGTINWTGNWVESGDDGSPTTGIITATGARLDFDDSPAGTSISRTAPVWGDSATISFTLSDQGIDNNEGVIAEYDLGLGAGWQEIQRITNGTLSGTNPLTIGTAGATSISIRFRSFGNWEAGDHAGVDNVTIAFDNAVGTQIQRTANLAGAASPSLSFTYAQANLDTNDDYLVVEASTSPAGPFTTLGTFNGAAAPIPAPPYDLTDYASSTTTIRFRVIGGFNQTNETRSIDNVDITYRVGSGTASSVAIPAAAPPAFLTSGAGCLVAPGGVPVTLTFSAIVGNPLPSGLTSITNTASTTSTQLPIAISDSVTNIVTNPSVVSASVAGRVWLDSDGDGAQDFGEPGIANVAVTLKDLWGTPLETLYTDVGGRYLFTGVAPGDDYYVEVEGGLPAGVAQSFPDTATYGAHRSVPFDLLAGENETGVDLGYRPATGTALFGDQVWVDANANGLRDPGEVALPGATVDLFLDANGNGVLDAAETTPVATTTSDASGHYVLSVSGLAGGEDYFVGVRAVSGYSLTTAGTYYFQDVVSGSAYLTADFGFVASTVTTYTISDRVWFDMDGSQAPNGAETGIAGVSVDLLDASLNVIATAITAADGTFAFNGVANGNYTVRISDTSGVLVNHTGTTSWAVARQRAESVASASVDRTASPSYGFRPTRSIGDTVFFDTSGDGSQDAGEGGIPGIVVELYQGSTLLYSTTTDANGRYFFAGLGDGSYIVSVPTLTGYAFTGTDAYPAEPGLQLDATISGGASYWLADFGFLATTPRALSGAVWNDADGDGAVDAGETGIGGVTLDVLSGTTVIATVLTDADGAYSVQGLAAGPYTVQLTDDNGTLTGLTATYEGVEGVAGVIDLQEAVDLTDRDVSDVNFGYRPPEVTFANIASVKAYLENGAAVVEWRTSLEIGTAGFHLYRFDPATGDWLRLNGRLLPGLVGHPEGGSYRFVDAGAPVTVGTPLSYVVEEVDVRGRAQAHGPYTVALLEEASSAVSDEGERPGSAWRAGGGIAGRMASPLAALSGRSASSLAALVPSDAGWGATLSDQREASAAGSAAASAVAEAIAGERRLAAARAAAPGSSSLLGEPTSSLASYLQRQPAGAGVFQQKSQAMADAVLARERASALQQRAAAAAKRVRRGGWAEVTTRESGVHYLTADQIAGPAGLAAGAVRGLITARQLAVSNRGRAVGYLPDAQGAGIYLYAEPVASIYTEENVYQIGLGAGQVMGTAGTGFRGLRATSFQETVHLERDTFAATSAIQDPEGDFWFWAYAFAGYEGLDTATVTVPARGVAGLGDASLRLQLAGGSDEPAEIDHQVIVSWNGRVVGESAWGGLGPHAVEIPLSPLDVEEGDNTLEVRAVNGAGVAMSLVYLDSVDLRYQREYRAVDDTLAFGAPRGSSVEVTGFSSPDILLLDVTTPTNPIRVAFATAAAPGGGYLIRFGTAGRGQAARFLALVRARAKTPVEVAASRLPSLASPQNRADYLLVVPDSLETAAAALAEYRHTNGLTTLVVPLAAIYSEFNGGIAEPTAVRKFLRYATSSWQTPPRYVTLVGRGTWDYKNVMGIGDNLMPPLLAASANGLFVSDVRLADLSGDDGIPEIAVGRLPVLTEQELLDYVAKIERQESAPAGTWQRRVLMAADNPDQGGSFTSDSDAVAALLPADHTVQKVYLSTTTPAAARLAIRDALNAGVGVLNYIGHGGLDRLADEDLWTSADTPSLVNADRLPFVLAMTCVAGNSGIPGYPSLGEAMTLKKDGGAVAFWGPTGLSENPLAVRLDKSFFEVVFVRNERVVGDATVRALGELRGLGAVPMRYMYNLLGEPVSRLPEGLAPVGP